MLSLWRLTLNQATMRAPPRVLQVSQISDSLFRILSRVARLRLVLLRAVIQVANLQTDRSLFLLSSSLLWFCLPGFLPLDSLQSKTQKSRDCHLFPFPACDRVAAHLKPVCQPLLCQPECLPSFPKFSALHVRHSTTRLTRCVQLYNIVSNDTYRISSNVRR